MIEGAWYCNYATGLRECHAPLTFPLTPLDIEDLDEPMGVGRSLYTQKQMEEFYRFQSSAGTRAAFIADQANRAFEGRTTDGQWGLALGNKAKEMMLDAVGLSFVPLYRIFGPISMLVLMLFFIIGITRIFLTIIVRAVSPLDRRDHDVVHRTPNSRKNPRAATTSPGDDDSADNDCEENPGDANDEEEHEQEHGDRTKDPV